MYASDPTASHAYLRERSVTNHEKLHQGPLPDLERHASIMFATTTSMPSGSANSARCAPHKMSRLSRPIRNRHGSPASHLPALHIALSWQLLFCRKVKSHRVSHRPSVLDDAKQRKTKATLASPPSATVHRVLGPTNPTIFHTVSPR